MNRKIRLSLFLPVVQVSVTGVLNYWANRVDWMVFGETMRSPGRFAGLDRFIVFARLTWRGVNAPAFLLSAPDGGDTVWNGAFGIRGLSYLLAVAWLWYLVGRFFDKLRGLSDQERRSTRPPRLAVTAVFMIWGVLLLALSILLIHDALSEFPNATIFANFSFWLHVQTYGVVTMTLFLVWSFALIAIHGARLTRALRRKRFEATSPNE